jgi:prenyltransferase beta subunit
MTTANKLVEELGTQKFSAERLQDGLARDFGSCLAFFLRLSEDKSTVYLTDSSIGMIQKGQRKDGGWSKQGEESSDIESTYRVMRALMLSKAKPKDMDAVDTFVYKHRNKDGGFAVKPGQDSSTSGAYYATMILMWLDELEKPEGKP